MITHVDKNLAAQIIQTVKQTCNQEIHFIDHDGIIYASSNNAKVGVYQEAALTALKSQAMVEIKEDNHFNNIKKGVNLPVFHNNSIITIIGIAGDPDEVRSYAYLAEQITQLLIRDQELYVSSRTETEMRNYIIQSLIHGRNLNQEHLYTCLAQMELTKTASLRCMVIKLHSRYNLTNIALIEQSIYQLFQSTSITLYTYNYPNEYIALINDTQFEACVPVFQNFAKQYDHIINIAIGGRFEISHMANSYRTALFTLKSLANKHTPFAVFDDLNLEIILTNLDHTTKDNYLLKTVAALSSEEMELLEIYYEEDMSLTKTCERLYLHKNTVQYKLDRIHKLCGYNPRKFRDAVILYIATRIH
ncbi:predicted glycolate dehydrogenase regulator [Lachnospiraceae bacterium KM106-2]|nr:predicted glycolate dehydrogenase regulator [Lachnospiraceae bacterium KM106-2]